MTHLLVPPFAALASALHGWGRFPKQLAIVLHAVWLCGVLYVYDAGYYSVLGVAIAVLCWRTCRTGRIAQKELDVINPSTLTARLDAIGEYKYALIAIAFGYVVLSIYIHVFLLFGGLLGIVGALTHQYLMNQIFVNYSVFSVKNWYDPKGKRFLDLRRLSELSGGFFIQGHLAIVCIYVIFMLISGM